LPCESKISKSDTLQNTPEAKLSSIHSSLIRLYPEREEKNFVRGSIGYEKEMRRNGKEIPETGLACTLYGMIVEANHLPSF